MSWVSLVAGLLFGIGLCVSGMTRPEKVLGFLDVTGAWDPTLLFVMGGAVGVHFGAYRLVRRWPAPRYAERFVPPSFTRIDARLCLGAALFGIGWGISGYCPGPALVSLPSGQPSALVFVLTMLLGMALARPVLPRPPASD
jgi:uncharacterized membrane protein YedE/YeeE